MPAVLRDAEEVRQLARLLVDPSAPFPNPEDWERLAVTATEERVGPLLTHELERQARFDALPAPARKRLRRDFYQSGARNVVHEHELGRILSVAPTRFVVLKGGALARSLYRDAALRPMSDIDLLVPDAAVDRWISAVSSLGYRATTPEMAPGLLRQCHYQWALTGGTTGDVMVELHWSLVGGRLDWRAPTMSWFWEQTEPWNSSSRATSPSEKPDRGPSRLSDTASLIYACAHLELQHGSSRAPLIWMVDIHRLAQRGRIDWSELVEASRQFRWSDAVLSALLRTRDLFNCSSLPPAVLDRLARDSSARAARHVRGKADPTATRAATVWQDLACLDWMARLSLTQAILLPRTGYMRWRYARWGRLWPVAYPYRWVQVICEGLSCLARRGLVAGSKG